MTSILKCLPVFFVLSCSVWEYEDNSSPHENSYPETYLSLIASDTIYAIIDEIISVTDPVSGSDISDTTWFYELETPLNIDSTILVDTLLNSFTTVTTSRQELHWWGEDTDGEVVGYQYRWNTDSTWKETMSESGVFFVPITKEFDVFQFEVSAIDNDGEIDNTPAQLVLPIKNSAPQISFRHLSNPFSDELPNHDNIHYTFPTRTFVWDVVDLDGSETIVSIFYAVDDTCNMCWTELDAAAHSSITLTNLPQGNHVFFLKAHDIAGASSKTIQFPDERVEGSPTGWVVKEPVGSILIVDDFPQDTPNSALNWYLDLLNSTESEEISYWEIGERLPFAISDITETLSYFDTVIWYAGYTGNFTFHDAETSIQTFIERGGNIFLNFTVFPDTSHISWFPMDEIIPLNPGGDIHSEKNLIPQNEIADTLTIGNPISVEVKGFESDALGFQNLYRLQLPENDLDLWSGNPTVCGSYQKNVNAGKAIILSLPLFKGYAPVLDLEWVKEETLTPLVLYAVEYSSNEIVWVVGEDGLIIKNQGNHSNWETMNPISNKDLRDITFLDSYTGWIVGKSGTILKTVDGGNVWFEQISGTSKTLYSVEALNENEVWVVGKSGTILHTTNGGETWVSKEVDTSSRLEDIQFINSSQGWIVGSNGSILMTQNGGYSWQSRSIPSFENSWFYSVDFIHEDLGWICGSEGLVLKTENSGIDWESMYSGVSETLYSLSFFNEELGYAVGSSGKILNSFNGGMTWNSIYSGVVEDLRSVMIINPDLGTIVGGNTQPFPKGVILNRSSGGNSSGFLNYILNDVFKDE